MKKFSLIGAICGVLSGIGMLVLSILDSRAPKILWILISIGFFIEAASLICNYYHFNKKTKNK